MQPFNRSLRRWSVPILAICAAVGLYLGASRGYSEGTSDYASAEASPGSVAAAKAIAPPPPPSFDEAAIRRIAKEEAQTLIAKAPAASSASAPAPRRRSRETSTEYTSPSNAGIVYAKPPRDADAGSTGGGASPPPASPGPVQQF